MPLGVDFELDVDMLRDALRRGSCANGFYLPAYLASWSERLQCADLLSRARGAVGA